MRVWRARVTLQRGVMRLGEAGDSKKAGERRLWRERGEKKGAHS